MVKLLENDLGFTLFEKVGRNIQLTKAGLEVFEYCKRIYGTVDELKQSLGQISSQCKGPILFGASEPITSHFLPSVIKLYLSKYNEVYPNIFSGPASMLFENLIKGELEFGIFFHIPDLHEKLEIFETKEVSYNLVVRNDLRKKKEILESFIGSREIDDVSTKKFPTLERLRKDYPQAKIKISSNNLTAHMEMCLQGLGVSILPNFLVATKIKEGLLFDVYPHETFKFKMKFIKRRSGVLSFAAKELVNACIEN